MTTTKAEQLAAEWQKRATADASRRNSAYDYFGMDNTPESVDPLGAKMAAELRRLAAVEAELAGAKKALALVQQHHTTAWNRGHEAGMRASRDAVKQATDSVARDAWGNTQLTEALLAVEAERDALQAALNDAAQSLTTIAENAGRRLNTDGMENYLFHFDQVRGYARSRAGVAIDAARVTGEQK